MIIGAPKEIKNIEYRAALVPICVRNPVEKVHRVLVENAVAKESNITDNEYLRAGAEL